MGINGIDHLKPSENIFPHKCKDPGCKNVVQHDDEPYCWRHAPENDEIDGYSAKAERENQKLIGAPEVVHVNVFDEENSDTDTRRRGW